MGCPSIAVLSKSVTFTITVHGGDGAPVDLDALPSYRVYENEGNTPILTGTMALLDDDDTTGFYSEQIQITAANGFEEYKTYTVRIAGAVAGVALQHAYSFVCLTSSAAEQYSDGVVGNAEVLAIVNQRLEREETTIAVELRGVLRALTAAYDILDADEDGALAAGADSVSTPTDYKTMLEVSIGDERLGLMDYADYLTRDENAAAGEPDQYCVWNDEVLFDTVAAAAYTVSMHYYRIHPGDVSTILLPAEWREAIYCLTTARVAAKYDLDDKAAKWEAIGGAEVARLAPLEHRQPMFVRNNDI